MNILYFLYKLNQILLQQAKTKNNNFHMQSKYRKLYLYASNNQVVKKKANESEIQFSLKKEKSIQHLKQLLNIKIELPPVVSVLEMSNLQQQKQQASKFKINQKIRIKHRLHYHHSTINQFKSSSTTQHFKPVFERSHGLDVQQNKIKVKLVENEESKKQKKYEKYINQYMKKIQQQHLLQKMPEENYRTLVQEACKQIRKKIIQDQAQIDQVEKGLEESNDHSILRKIEKRRKRASKKYQHESLGKLHHNEDELRVYKSLHKPNQRLYLAQNAHKKSKSSVGNNLYKFDLQKLERVNQLKHRQRKRSQKQFVRNLTKHSLLQGVQPKQQ